MGYVYEVRGRLPYQSLMKLLRTRLAEECAPDDLLEDSWLIELQRLVPDPHDCYPDLPLPVDDAAAGARLMEAMAQQDGSRLRDCVRWSFPATVSPASWSLSAPASPSLPLATRSMR